MKPSYQLILLLSGAFLLGVASGSSFSLQGVFAQGYDGLIAPPPSEGKAQGRQEPQGYEGLIPGHVPKQYSPEPQNKAADYPQLQQRLKQKAATQRAQPKGAAPQRKSDPQRTYVRRVSPRTAAAGMTSRPGHKSRAPDRPKTIDEIRMLSAPAVPLEIRQGMPTQLKKTLSGLLSPWQRRLLSNPSPRIDGMLPAEATTKNQIAQVMHFVNDKKLSGEQRRDVINKAEKKLRGLANVFQLRDNLTDDVYIAMGTPGIYMKEDREGVKKSLARIEAALAELRKQKYGK